MESDSRDGGARQWHKRPSEARSPGSIETPIQAKRGKSEEKEGLAQELKYEDDAMDIPIQKNIKDVIDEIRDMKDDISTQRNQIAFLLYNQVDRQRAECSTKLIMKNFWKYSDGANQSLLQTHREAIFKWVASQAGLSTEQIDNATYSHKNGRFLSPFTLVDVKDSSCRQVVMEWYKKEISDKGLYIHEWNTQDGMLHLQSAPGNLEHINGKIKIEPCIGTFDKLQSEPLKAAMTALSNIAAAPVEFKHSWKNLTIQKKNSSDYMVWVALDHLYGTGRVYVNKEQVQEKEFEKAFREAYEGLLCRKAVGSKGRGKDRNENGKGISPEELLRAVGLTGDTKGSYLKGGFLTIKASTPFMFEVRGIAPDQFARKYEEHLSRIADRILHPKMMH